MKVYLDNGASNTVDKEVIQAMMPFFTKQYGNALHCHQSGVASKKCDRTSAGNNS